MAAGNQYQGYIFDYGGVLAHHQSEEDQAKMAAVAGIAPDRFTELYWAERLAYDKALVAGPEYWELLAQQAGTVLTLEQIEKLTEMDTVSWMNFDDVMWDWIKELRSQRRRIALLSNMPRDLGEALRSRTDKLQQFDFVTLSYEIGSAKPEAAIYEHCLAGLGTHGRETLFLDDRIANVQGAEMLGIQAVQFTSRDAVLPQLVR